MAEKEASRLTDFEQGQESSIPWLYDDHTPAQGEYSLKVLNDSELAFSIPGTIQVFNVHLPSKENISVSQCSQQDLARFEQAQLISQYVHPEWKEVGTPIVVMRNEPGTRLLLIKQGKLDFTWGLTVNTETDETNFFYPGNDGNFNLDFFSAA